MGTDPREGDDFLKVPLPRDLPDDVEGHAKDSDQREGEDFLKVPLPRDQPEDAGESSLG